MNPLQQDLESGTDSSVMSPFATDRMIHRHQLPQAQKVLCRVAFHVCLCGCQEICCSHWKQDHIRP